MQVFQTAGVPPNIGRIIFAIMGWTRNKREALRKIATEKMIAILDPPLAGAAHGPSNAPVTSH
jgi:hypothetical protein